VVDFSSFSLGLMDDMYESASDDDPGVDDDGDAEDAEEAEEEDPVEPDHIEIFEKMEASLPKDAIEIGVLEDMVSNWTSWKIEVHYYLVPLRDQQHQWALVMIRWDDNWGRYEWESGARGSGFKSAKDARRTMVRRLFEHQRIDLEAERNEAYREFLDQL
jgi:hypothetical protein